MINFPNGAGGGDNQQPLRPPTPEEYKRMWLAALQSRKIDYEREAEKNRKKAIKEILQEQVKRAVKPNDRLSKIFYDEINKGR